LANDAGSRHGSPNGRAESSAASTRFSPIAILSHVLQCPGIGLRAMHLPSVGHRRRVRISHGTQSTNEFGLVSDGSCSNRAWVAIPWRIFRLSQVFGDRRCIPCKPGRAQATELLRAVHQPGGVDDLEVATGDRVQLVEDVIVE
jgi:hypothetical protein